MREIDAFKELETLPGQEIGASEWIEVTQDMVDRFADLTGDDQWIHTDVVRARKHSPFGGTVAHGFLTLSLIPRLCRKLFRIKGGKTSVNYGLNRVRFLHPVKVGSKIRAVLRVISATAVGRRRAMRFVSRVTIEVKGAKKPACVAETVTIVYR